MMSFNEFCGGCFDRWDWWEFDPYSKRVVSRCRNPEEPEEPESETKEMSVEEALGILDGLESLCDGCVLSDDEGNEKRMSYESLRKWLEAKSGKKSRKNFYVWMEFSLSVYCNYFYGTLEWKREKGKDTVIFPTNLIKWESHGGYRYVGDPAPNSPEEAEYSTPGITYRWYGEGYVWSFLGQKERSVRNICKYRSFAVEACVMSFAINRQYADDGYNYEIWKESRRGYIKFCKEVHEKWLKEQEELKKVNA